MYKAGLRRTSYVQIAAVLALTLGWASAAQAGPYTSTVVATGLNNPRGLSFGPDGALYIAEAGLASGTGPSTTARGTVFTHTQTGSVTRYQSGVQTRVTTGLPSIYGSNGNVNGPNDIVFNAAGASTIAIGLGLDPRVRASDLAPGGGNLARVLTPGGSVDVGAYEATVNPAGGPIDSNPWHLAIAPGGTLLTDAGGNSLLLVAPNGSINTLASFASRPLGGGAPTEPVPTGIAIGPDGAYYVGELTGAPFVPGAAQIYRVPSGGGAPTVYATGFTMISDLAFGADGSLYVLEYDSNGLLNAGSAGALWQILVSGARNLIFGDLTNPTGLAIGSDGAFYVSNFGGSSGGGELVRISAIPEPQTFALALAGVLLMGLFRRARD